MAHRREDVGLLEYIQDMDADIRRLKTGDKGVRQNDLRIGNQLIQEGDDDNTLKVTDLRNGDQFVLPGGSGGGGLNEVTFSWPGEVKSTGLYDHSPPYWFENGVTLKRVIWAMGSAPPTPPTGGATYAVGLDVLKVDTTVISYTYLEHYSTPTAPLDKNVYIHDVNIPVPPNSMIQVVLYVDGDPYFMQSLSLTVKW